MNKQQLEQAMDQTQEMMKAVLAEKHDPKCHWAKKKQLKARFDSLVATFCHYKQAFDAL